jgi:hypothetical protein
MMFPSGSLNKAMVGPPGMSLTGRIVVAPIDSALARVSAVLLGQET